MKVTILGCGSSSGVPVIGCDCPVCLSTDPKNKRLRVSVLVEDADRRLLIDTSPDFRQQCLSNNIKSIDAVLYTHSHADHLHGIDDIRSINHINNAVLDAYMDAPTLEIIKRQFPYVFQKYDTKYGWYLPSLNPIVFDYDEPFKAAGVEVVPFEQIHGKSQTAGFRIGDFAYSTDVNRLTDKAYKALEGVGVWVVDCLRYDTAPSHSHLEQTLYWIKQVKPSLAVLTHMAHDFDYETLRKELPACVVPAYDGMVIEI